MIRTITEAIVVVVVGVAVGLGVNASRGDQKFAISRNHFARKIIASPTEHDDGANNNNFSQNKSAGDPVPAHDVGDANDVCGDAADGVVVTRNDSGSESGAEGEVDTDRGADEAQDEATSHEWKALVASGYQPIRHEQVIADFQSPDYEAGLIVFVDARDDAHYAKGHIAGAYQLDHYLVDNYIDTVLPACQNGTKVVVYCNGGECEDSMFVAGDLIEQGVDPNKVFVYVGGVTAWKRDGLPFESGERYSGQEVYLNE